MSLQQFTTHIKTLMNKGSLKELEQSYKHLKARLQALINPEAQTFNAKKDLQAAQLWVERNAADDEGADGRCPSRYVVFMCFKLTKIFITYYLYCFSALKSSKGHRLICVCEHVGHLYFTMQDWLDKILNPCLYVSYMVSEKKLTVINWGAYNITVFDNFLGGQTVI